MSDERKLTAAWGQIANGYGRDTVIDAAGNILLNAIRQDHATLASAEERFDELVHQMREALRHVHYHRDGTRNDRRIILPSLRAMIPG